MEIPKQLQNKEFRFVLLKSKSKIPFEKDWANNGYAFDNPKLLKHIENGGNYGVIGGYGGLIILDKDDDKLPIDLDTFTIQTGTGGKHYYILSDYPNNHVFVNELGELRAKNYQVVGAGSIHPNGNEYKILKDLPILKIDKIELADIIEPYLRNNDGDSPIARPIFGKGSTIENAIDCKDTSRSGLEFRKVLALLRKGKSREEIYKEMNAYSKWSTSPEQYKSVTFEKAEDIYLKEQEIKEEKIESIESKEEYTQLLNQSYSLINSLLRKYLDWTEQQYQIATLWIIGTYSYQNFPTYPYLFLNATKGSGKSRAMNLLTSLSYNGIVLNSMTEATLFRTKGTLGIDEAEGLERKGKEALRELINSAYKHGTKVRRMKKVKTLTGEEQVVEEFDVYRPIILANISGMESVLADRCIPLIIEKSFNKKVVNLIEIFEYEDDFKVVKKMLNQCSLCRCSFSGEYIQMYKDWNNFVINNNINTTNYTNNTNYTNSIQALKSLNLGFLTGRELELSLPLCILASEISEDVLKETTLNLIEIFSSKRDDDLADNSDISLIDFVSQESEENEKYFKQLSEILRSFENFVGIHEDWLNCKWLGRALKRLDLTIEKRRKGKGMEVRLNIKKAKERIQMFK